MEIMTYLQTDLRIEKYLVIYTLYHYGLTK